MANWVYRLELKDLWKAKEEKKISVSELAKLIARRIKKLRCYKEYEDELEGIVIDFEICSDDVEEFDSILEQLYDWADTPLVTPKGEMQIKMCWISTF